MQQADLSVGAVGRIAMASQQQYPAGALVRVKQICGSPREGIPGLLPINASTWWDWVSKGRVPAGRKIGPRTTAWPIEDVLAVAQGSAGNEQAAA